MKLDGSSEEARRVADDFRALVAELAWLEDRAVDLTEETPAGRALQRLIAHAPEDSREAYAVLALAAAGRCIRLGYAVVRGTAGADHEITPAEVAEVVHFNVGGTTAF